MSSSVSHPSGKFSLFSQWTLIKQLVRREVHQRYRGSMLGVLWSLITPLLLLAVYTFIFTAVIKVRWGTGAEGSIAGKAEFALFLFSGMMIHSFFVDCLSRAPLLILGNANLVKKVVFPLEILPVAMIGASLFTLLTCLAVLLGAYFLIHLSFQWTVLLLPFIWVPYLLFSLGVAWLLSSIGVFIRDLSQLTSLLSMLLMFLSPVFYPITALPESLRQYAYLNPLTWVIEQTRGVLLNGVVPDTTSWVIYMSASAAICFLGFACFQKLRRGFADSI